MKKTILAVALMFVSVTITFAQEWNTNFETAKEMARKQNKPIVLVFQGSDWCAPCIKLDREVWSTEVFKKYAKDHYIMAQADFPRRKKNSLPAAQTKANAELAETYNKSGVFPFVVVLDSNGNVLGETSYKKTTPKAYIDTLNSFIK